MTLAKNRILLITGLLFYLILSVLASINGGDFDVYLEAAIKLKDYQNIYAPPFDKNMPYLYSPLFALLLIPFSFNFFLTEFIWLLLSGFLLYRSWHLINNYLELRDLSKKELHLLIGISFFFILRFWLYNISRIQITIFLLWAILESIHLIKANKWPLGSVLLSFACNIKIIPIVILPYLIYRQKFKAALFVVLLTGLFLYLPSAFIGYEFNNFLLTEWWRVINPLNSEHLIELSSDSQSIMAIIPVYFTNATSEILVNCNILNLSTQKVYLIANLIRVFLIIFTLYFLRTPSGGHVKNLTEIRAISYILLLIPLIFPHQQKYAFILIFPMIVYLTYYYLISWKYRNDILYYVQLSVLLFISVVFTPFIGSDILGKYLYELIQYLRLLGINTLLIIIYAVIADPRKIEAYIYQPTTK